MLIDCDQCPVRGHACGDCVVTVLLGPPAGTAGGGIEFDAAEQVAIAHLAEVGLVPPLAPAQNRQLGIRSVRDGLSGSAQEIA